MNGFFVRMGIASPLSSFFGDVRIQESLLILLVSFTAAFTAAGALISKLRLFDGRQAKKSDYSPSRSVGRVMVISGGIMFGVCLIVLLWSLFTK